LENQAAQAAVGAGLDVRIAQELMEKARAEGVSLVGPDGLLSQITKTVRQTALDAEMTEHLGYEKTEAQHSARQIRVILR
jgi:putative transposase